MFFSTSSSLSRPLLALQSLDSLRCCAVTLLGTRTRRQPEKRLKCQRTIVNLLSSKFKSNSFSRFLSGMKSIVWKFIHSRITRISAGHQENAVSMRLGSVFCEFFECENLRKNQCLCGVDQNLPAIVSLRKHGRG